VSVTFFAATADGFPVARDDLGLRVNVASANAAALLRVLGVSEGPDLAGGLDLPMARRALMKARFRATYGARRVAGRTWVLGADREYVLRRVSDLEWLVEAAAAAGAARLAWG